MEHHHGRLQRRRPDGHVPDDPVEGWWIKGTAKSTGSGFNWAAPGLWSAGWQMQVSDVNGDGAGDIVFYSAATGTWLQGISNGARFSYGPAANWGLGWTLIAPPRGIW